ARSSPQSPPVTTQATATATSVPASACPVPSVTNTNSCSAANEALLPPVLTSADTAATSTTVGCDSHGSVPVTRPRAKPNTAAHTVIPSRFARYAYGPEPSPITVGSTPADTSAPIAGSPAR